MSARAHLAVLLCALGVALRGLRTKPASNPRFLRSDLVVLLPDPGDGAVGRAVVSSVAAASELAAARESTTVSPNQPPSPVTVMSEADVARIFGDALSALPPRHRISCCIFVSSPKS